MPTDSRSVLMDRLGRWLFMLRNHIAGIPIVFALLCTCGEWEGEWMWAVALLVVAAGILVRAWATCHCNYGQAGKHRLARTGPYEYIRNPLYVGNILILAGVTVASELVWLVPATIVWSFLTYAAVVKFEEKRMVNKFGAEYAEYLASVPAWLPVARARAGSKRLAPFLPALAWQSSRLLWLAPFVLKDLGVLGLGSG